MTKNVGKSMNKIVCQQRRGFIFRVQTFTEVVIHGIWASRSGTQRNVRCGGRK